MKNAGGQRTGLTMLTSQLWLIRSLTQSTWPPTAADNKATIPFYNEHD